MKVRDGLLLSTFLSSESIVFRRSTFLLFVKFRLTVGVSYVIFEPARSHVVEGVFGVVLNGRL